MKATTLRNLASGKCEGNIGEEVEQEEKLLCDEMETVKKKKHYFVAG